MQIPLDPRTGMPVEVSFDWIATLPRSLRTWLSQRKLEQAARQLRRVPEADLNSVGRSRFREPRAT
jgi:hypothetical protein